MYVIYISSNMNIVLCDVLNNMVCVKKYLSMHKENEGNRDLLTSLRNKDLFHLFIKKIKVYYYPFACIKLNK